MGLRSLQRALGHCYGNAPWLQRSYKPAPGPARRRIGQVPTCEESTPETASGPHESFNTARVNTSEQGKLIRIELRTYNSLPPENQNAHGRTSPISRLISTPPSHKLHKFIQIHNGMGGNCKDTVTFHAIFPYEVPLQCAALRFGWMPEASGLPGLAEGWVEDRCAVFIVTPVAANGHAARVAGPACFQAHANISRLGAMHASSGTRVELRSSWGWLARPKTHTNVHSVQRCSTRTVFLRN